MLLFVREPLTLSMPSSIQCIVQIQLSRFYNTTLLVVAVVVSCCCCCW